MSLLQGNIPPLHAYVRKEFLYNLESHVGEFEEVYAFAVISTPDQALNFTVMTRKGAQYTRIPIHALCWKEDAPVQSLPTLQRWDCFSYNFSVVAFDFLRNMRCRVVLRDGKEEWGTYLWTIDWYGSNEALDTGFSEIPEAHKTGHFIQLDNGNFVLQPNNFVYWNNSAVIPDPFTEGEHPDYKVNTYLWSVENRPVDNQYLLWVPRSEDGKVEPSMGKPRFLNALLGSIRRFWGKTKRD